MPAPKYQVLPGMPLTKGEQGRGLSLHIRLGWGLTAKNTGDGDRGLCGKLRKNSSTRALKNKVFSQHITLLLLHSLRGRSSQPLSFQQAGWGLAADFNLKPSPGDNVIVPHPLCSLAGRGCLSGSARPPSLYTPLLAEGPGPDTEAWESPSRFYMPLCLWGGKEARLTCHSAPPSPAPQVPRYILSIRPLQKYLHTSFLLLLAPQK